MYYTPLLPLDVSIWITHKFGPVACEKEDWLQQKRGGVEGNPFKTNFDTSSETVDITAARFYEWLPKIFCNMFGAVVVLKHNIFVFLTMVVTWWSPIKQYCDNESCCCQIRGGG